MIARALGTGLFLGASLLLVGCGCGKESDHTVVYLDGLVVGNEYQSSTEAGPWLHFPGGRRYELHHHLGAEPTQYIAYLAFAEHDVNPDEYTVGTGNSARFRDVNDEYLVVENDTCASYYLRVVASLPVSLGEGGAAGD